MIIQSTVFSSLRGNITQDMSSSKITRSNQIDARYSSYAVCKTETYNPFLNLEHTVHREQGFLVYVPINNDLQLHDMILSFSFYRPANLTGGAALRSRSLTTTKGIFYFPLFCFSVDISLLINSLNIYAVAENFIKT